MNQFDGSFRKLIVWKEAKQLALDVYQATGNFPNHELYSMTKQLRRSSSSIMANIAEGNYRKTNKDRLNFFITARASLAETDCFLELAYDLKYLAKQEYKKLLDQLNKTAFLLQKLIASLS